MTKILFDLKETSPQGDVPIDAQINCYPVARRKDGTVLVTRRGFTERTGFKPTIVELHETALDSAWLITINSHNNDVVHGFYAVPVPHMVEGVEVPTSFNDLVLVDPESLVPDADPDPLWWAMARSTVISGEVSPAGDLILTHYDGKTTNAGRVKGDRGERGERGLKGDKGDKGDTGEGFRVIGSVPSAVELPITANEGDGIITEDDGHLHVWIGETFVDVGQIKGDKGDRGDGVTFEYSPSIPTRLFGDAPSSYAPGLTIGVYAAAPGNWPLFGYTSGFAIVETVRSNNYPGSAKQTIRRYQGDNKPLTRVALNNETWGSLQEQATTSPASTTANGLMSAADKIKVDRIVVTESFGFSESATGTANSAALSAAIDTTTLYGLKLRVPAGIYKMNAMVSIPSGADIDFGKAVLDFSQSSASYYLGVAGSIGVSITCPSVSKGVYSLTIPGHGLVAGDWMKIRSDDLFDSANTDTRKGELIQVGSVSGDTVNFVSPTCDSYDSNVVASKVTMIDNVKITGGTLRGNYTPNTGKIGLRVIYSNALRLNGLRTEGIDQTHISIRDSVDAKATLIKMDWAMHASTGYGISFANACRDSGVSNSTSSNIRHAFSTNNIVALGGVVRRVYAHDLTVFNTSAATGGVGGDAIDTHGAAEDITISNCAVLSSTGQGINVECQSAKIINNTVMNTASKGIAFHNESDARGSVMITGNKVSNTGSIGIHVFAGQRGNNSVNYTNIVSHNEVGETNGVGIQVGSSAGTWRDRNAVVSNNVVVNPIGIGIRVLNVDTLSESGNNVYGGTGGISIENTIYASIGQSTFRGNTPDLYIGIDLKSVTRSRVQPGAVRASGTSNIGLRIDSGCSDLSVGKTSHFFATTKLQNNGQPTVILD